MTGTTCFTVYIVLKIFINTFLPFFKQINRALYTHISLIIFALKRAIDLCRSFLHIDTFDK